MELAELRQSEHEIFASALTSVDARAAVRKAAQFDGRKLRLFEQTFDLSLFPVYVLAIGKAAFGMATGLNDSIGKYFRRGIIAGPPIKAESSLDPERWRSFAGGHPLPNQDSLAAARAGLEMLKQASAERALVLFLISGGGSAMIELPRDHRITLADLREANGQLISCGATIREINAVRRAFSAIKGGGLATHADGAKKLTLIVSDTNAGDERSVASGPTLLPPVGEPSACEVIEKYALSSSLPPSILRAVSESSQPTHVTRVEESFHVLLDNGSALHAAARKAESLGFAVEIAEDICEQPIQEGCELLLSRCDKLANDHAGRRVCLLSGGEFSCPVKGDGVGGRNLETALRCAIFLDKHREQNGRHIAVLSGGTDGLDGNSPASGAIADETTVSRAFQHQLDPPSFLDRSDSFNFFRSLGDELITGATGTNVRDLRVILAS